MQDQGPKKVLPAETVARPDLPVIFLARDQFPVAQFSLWSGPCGQPHLAHAAFADQLEQLIRADDSAGSGCRGQVKRREPVLLTRGRSRFRSPPEDQPQRSLGTGQTPYGYPQAKWQALSCR